MAWVVAPMLRLSLYVFVGSCYQVVDIDKASLRRLVAPAVHVICRDAARAYQRHHGVSRFAPQQPPVQLAFADRLPSCSRSPAAAAGAPSVHLWVLQAAAGGPEKVTDDLREAGLIPKGVHRWEPEHTWVSAWISAPAP